MVDEVALGVSHVVRDRARMLRDQDQRRVAGVAVAEGAGGRERGAQQQGRSTDGSGGRYDDSSSHGVVARRPLGRRALGAAGLLTVPVGTLPVRVSQKTAGTKCAPSEWAPGDYAVRARIVVAAAGAIGTSALLLRSPLPAPRSLGHGFTCHPALILVAEHPRPITNDVGHPKSYFVDHGASERFVLETCMYFPFVTAKSLTGFGATHSAIMHALPRLQMILILACDHVASGNRIAVSRTGSP